MKRTGALIVACITFLALGLVTAALGPALPDLAAQSGSSLAAVGGLFTALFMGSLISLTMAGALADRFGQAPVLLLGTLLLATGTVGFTLMHNLPAMMALATLCGVGHGAVDIATNLLIARLFANRSVSALNLVNVFFGLGAMAGPAIAGLTLRHWGTALSGLWAGAALMVVAALLVPLLPSRTACGEAGRPSGGGSRVVLRSTLLWTLGLMLLLYVGLEQGISGWATAYLSRTTTLDLPTAALATAGFWMALTAGRVLAVILGSRLSPGRLLSLSLTGAAGAGVLLLLSTGSVVLSVGAILALGLCFGPVFPTALGVTTTVFREAPGTAGSVAVAMGSLGGMLLPWVQGLIMEGTGPRPSITLVAVGTLLMLLLQRRTATRYDV